MLLYALLHLTGVKAVVLNTSVSAGPRSRSMTSYFDKWTANAPATPSTA